MIATLLSITQIVVDNCNGYGYRSKNKAIAYLNSLYKTTEKKGKHKKANKVFNTQLRSALSESQEEIDWSKVKLMLSNTRQLN